MVVGETMFLTGADNQVIAIDLHSGDTIWEYRRVVNERIPPCCGRRNRGIAVLGGRVFHNTLDGRLVALEARTGRELWNVEVVDYRDNYSMTGAPLATKNGVVVGVSGGDYGAPGVIDAYDPVSGRRLWRFHTIPQPGQSGHETWPGDNWKKGGGATWLTGTYDPELGLVYWTVGNPAKIFNPASRPGDNLFTCSVVALDVKTGTLRWHYQFTPNDGNDWDANSMPVLVNDQFEGKGRKLMMFASRNCFFYLLDRETGKFLRATAFCEQNWNDGFTKEGRPIRRPASIPSPSGPLIKPGVTGGANWMAPSYDVGSSLFIVKNYRGGSRVFSEEGPGVMGGRTEQPLNEPKSAAVTAIDTRTGAIAWDVEQSGDNNSGILATASNLVFTGNSHGHLTVLDTKTGRELWRYRLGGEISMAPITYLYNGRQELAVFSGGSLFVFCLQ